MLMILAVDRPYNHNCQKDPNIIYCIVPLRCFYAAILLLTPYRNLPLDEGVSGEHSHMNIIATKYKKL